jgi:lysophospholipase L1-like esterase
MKKMQAWAARAMILTAVLAMAACATPPGQAPGQALVEAVTPAPNLEAWASWWMPRHEAKLREVRQPEAENAKLLFIGDSITQGWETAGKEIWKRRYQPYEALNIGFSGDRTEHVLWRLQHGEVDGLHPKVAVLLIGTNNSSHRQDDPRSTAAGIERIVGELLQRMPGTKILLLGIFPREDKPGTPVARINDEINAILPGLADGRRVFFLNINKTWLGNANTVSKQIMPDLLHLNANGYELWAAAMEPTLQKLLGQE